MRLSAELFKTGTTSPNCSFKLNVSHLFTSSFLVWGSALFGFSPPAAPGNKTLHTTFYSLRARSLLMSVMCWQEKTSNETARGSKRLAPVPLVFDQILVRHVPSAAYAC